MTTDDHLKASEVLGKVKSGQASEREFDLALISTAPNSSRTYPRVPRGRGRTTSRASARAARLALGGADVGTSCRWPPDVPAPASPDDASAPQPTSSPTTPRATSAATHLPRGRASALVVTSATTRPSANMHARMSKISRT